MSKGWLYPGVDTLPGPGTRDNHPPPRGAWDQGYPPTPGRNDRHLWKHYLPPTWLAGGKYGSLNLRGQSWPIGCKSNQVTMGQRSSANDMTVNMLLYHSVFGGRVKMELLVFYHWKISKHIVPPANEFWGKVMFLHLSVSHSVCKEACVARGGYVWEGRLNGREGDMHGNVRHGGEYVWQGRGHAWWVCMAGVEACMAGGLCGRRHVWWGMCMAEGVFGRRHAWQGACMEERRPLKQAVRILLECILVCHREFVLPLWK